MTIGVIILIALAVFGSVYMVKPSPRQKRLAEERLNAIKMGLQVKMENFTPDSKRNGVRDEIKGTLYTRIYPDVKSSDIVWRVVRQQGWESVGLPNGWSWHDESKEGETDLSGLSELLQTLPEDIYLIEKFENRIGILTGESKESGAENIQGWIETVKQFNK